jgi:aminopeptidase-like protein
LHDSTPGIGEQLHSQIKTLFPFLRSITGEGLRQTLRWIGEQIPLQIHEVPSEKPALDWTVPAEWNVREAYVNGPDGTRVVDLRDHPLHLMGYSVPVRKRMSLGELKPHLFSLPDHPPWIPYRTSYYQPNWGFCLRDETLRGLAGGEYEVVIDSTLEPGSLSYGECVIPGETSEEILFSCHCCHPGLCNDNLSGIVVARELARRLVAKKSRFTYRFVFVPGTIGAIVWLSRNEANLSRMKAGLVLAMLGDGGPITYKQTRHGNSLTDLMMMRALSESKSVFHVEQFTPYGYDERQYNSPGFKLPIGRLTRTPHGRFPEYHTSGDDLAFVKAGALEESLGVLERFVDVVEGNSLVNAGPAPSPTLPRRTEGGGRRASVEQVYLNTQPKGEPQLGRRGLFRAIGGAGDPDQLHMAMLWMLNQSDGGTDLADIASKSQMPIDTLREAADILLQHGLLIEKT